MKYLPSGGQWLFTLLLTLWGVVPVGAQSPKDASFLSTLGELREATYSDRAIIVERLSQGGHPEDRLYFRNNDQKVFIVKPAEGDPLSTRNRRIYTSRS